MNRKRTLVAAACVAQIAWSACSRERPVSQRDTAESPAGPSSAATTTSRATDRFSTSKGDLVVSPLDHASVLFGWDGKAVYVDPTSPAIDDQRLPKADVIFVTEAHFEHLDAVALERLSRPGTIVVGPPSVASAVHVDITLENGESHEAAGIFATAMPLYGTRGPAPGSVYHERGRANGYVLDFGGTHIYVSGDSECTPEMAGLTGIDVAFVAIGAPIAMTASEAARCVAAFEPRVVLPYHDWRVDLSDFERQATAHGVDVRKRNFYPRAERWRVDAVRACSEGQWGICRDRLDLAKDLDPRGESDPRVIHAREQVRAWKYPFPAWW